MRLVSSRGDRNLSATLTFVNGTALNCAAAIPAGQAVVAGGGIIKIARYFLLNSSIFKAHLFSLQWI